MKIVGVLMFSIVVSLVCFTCKQNNNEAIYTKDKDVSNAYKLATNKDNSVIKRLADINKAFNKVNSYTEYKVIKKIIDLKTYLHSKNEELDSAIVYSKVLLKVAVKQKDTSIIGKTYFKLGRYYNKKNQLDSAYYNYNESNNMFFAIKDSSYLSKNYLNMAIILSNIGDYSSSDEMAVEGLKFLENSNDDITIASLENCLAISARKRGDYEDALYRYDKAINKTDLELNKLKYLNNKAYIYIKNKNYDKAIDLLKAIQNEIHKKLELNNPFVIKVNDNLAYASWLLSNDNIYEEKLLQSLNNRKDQDDLLGEIISYDHLSHFYSTNDIQKSKYYALKMYNTAMGIGSLDDQVEALKRLMDLNEQDTDYTKYSKNFVKLTDSIESVRYKKANQFAKIRYESEKRKAKISRLEALSAKKELSLERLQIQRTLITILSIALLFIGYVIYKNIKIRHKKEKMVQVYQTETTISKRIHDEVANDVYNAMTKLQSSGVINKEDVIDDLDYIYKRARDISKEHGSIDFDENFVGILDDLFLNFKSDDVRVITRGLNKID